MKILVSNMEHISYKVKENDILIVSKNYKEGIVISGLTHLKYNNNHINLSKNCFIDIPKDYKILEYKDIDNPKNVRWREKIKIVEDINSNNDKINTNNSYFEFSSLFGENRLYIGLSRVCICINSNNLKIHCKNLW